MNHPTQQCAPARGILKAIIQNEPFIADTVWILPMGGVAGMRGDKELVYLRFASDLTDGDYTFGGSNAAAYLGKEESWTANMVSLQNFKSSQSPNGALISGCFHFVAVKDNLERIHVNGGEFSIAGSSASTHSLSGQASALLIPPMVATTGFITDRLTYAGNAHFPQSVLATQERPSRGSLGSLGVLLLLKYENTVTPQVAQAFVIVDQVLVKATLDKDLSVVFEPGLSLSIDFALSFSHAYVHHSMKKGHIEMRL